MQLFIRLLDGKTLTVKVTFTTTVLDLKRHIKSVTGTAMGFQRLIWTGQQLDDSKSIGELCIPEFSTIHLTGRLVFGQIFVEFPNGDDYMFQWQGDLMKLKQSIAQHNIPIESQTLRHDKLIETTSDVEELFTKNTLGVTISLNKST